MSGFLQKHFQAISEEYPAELWLAYYRKALPGYRDWFLKEGEFNRPTYRQCANALAEHMPEMVPLWQHLIKLTQANDLESRLLSFYNPAPYLSGCSQAVWLRYNPVLVRNYDYDPKLCEGRIVKTKWHDTEVIASTDCLWGVLDGMNEHGLTLSLSFGGSDEIGDGFGIPIILRYILEFCQTTTQATDTLCRIPTHMAYNVTIIDRSNHINTIELSPFSTPKVSHTPLAVNHQGDFELTNYAMFSKSHERKQALIEKMYDPLMTIESFINAFEYEPLFASNYDDGFGTLYTAVYNAQLRAMEYRWPYNVRMYQSFESFEPQDFWVTY